MRLKVKDHRSMGLGADPRVELASRIFLTAFVTGSTFKLSRSSSGEGESNETYQWTFFFLRGHTCSMWKFPGSGSNWSCSRLPMQPQQCQIGAVSVTYTTAHTNAGSLTHYARPGIEPESSWVIVVTSEPQRELLNELLFFWLFLSKFFSD